jgi:MFS family permease
MATHESLSAREVVVVGSPHGGRGWLGTFRALRHRNYRLFFVGQFISLIGSWIQLTALMWDAFHLTGTSRWPALVAAAQMLPAFLLGAWGGVLAERRPRRQLVLLTQSALMVLALLLAWITYVGEETVWHLLVISLAIGFVNAVDLPARLAFLMDMVGKDDMVNAVGLNSLLFNLARVAGPTFAIWLLPLGGPELCFLVNGLSFLAVLSALARMRLSPAVPGGKQCAGWKALREGFGYVTAHPVLSLLLPLTVATALFGWPILSLLPALAKKQLHAGDSGYSSLLSAFGAGALLAALLVATFGSMARRWLFIGAGVVIASAGLLGMSYAGTLVVGMRCSALVGVGLVLFFATSQAVFQLSALDQNRGRVMGIYSIVLTGAHPLGNILSGPAADHVGERLVLRLLGCAILTVALVVLGRRLAQRQGMGPPQDFLEADHVLAFPDRSVRRAA